MIFSFDEGADEPLSDMLAVLIPGYTIQVVRTGESFIPSSEVCEQDYAYQSNANGILVLNKIDSNAEPFGDDVTVDLADVQQIHVY